MFLRFVCGRHAKPIVSYPVRTIVSSRSASARKTWGLARIGLTTGAALTTSVLLANALGTIHADAEHLEHKAQSERPSTPLSALLRSYVVYSLCSIPPLVDWSPVILSTVSAIPGLKQITEAIVRNTFFDQFVGGDTAEDAVPLLEQLRAENKGCLFAYSVEVDEGEAAGKAKESAKQSVHKQIVAETLHCIDVAADFEDKHSLDGGRDLRGRKTWVAIKLTAMLPHAQTLTNFSKFLLSTRPSVSPPVPFPGRPLVSDFGVLSAYPASGSPLTETDVADLRELRDDLRAICQRAKERGVRIIIDAEHSWYQPAIDAFALSLQREFNKLQSRSSSWFRSSSSSDTSTVQPLVYQTYQAYLRRTPEYLRQSLEVARADGYSLGVKLVRGAYHPHELGSHTTRGAPNALSISPDFAPPVWATKPETDACYNTCAALVLAQIRADIGRSRTGATPSVGVLFGTHNWESCDMILEQLRMLGMARADEDGALWMPEDVTERVAIGQLYGMSDALTNSLVDRTRCTSPFVIKYIPYGRLAEVMPYLSRRAIENKSVLGNGGAADERKRAGMELWNRLFG